MFLPKKYYLREKLYYYEKKNPTFCNFNLFFLLA